MRIDLHVHTTNSTDGLCTVEDAVASAMKKGLDGIAITDHNTIAGHRDIERLSKDGFVIIPGAEISSTHGHIVALGIRELIPRGLSPAETVERIKKQGGVAIAAHPFSPLSRPRLAFMAKFDAVEGLNARAIFPSNQIARRYARINKVPIVGGSDAHRCSDIGMAYTVIDCEPRVDSILSKIERGETSAVGQTLPLPSYLWRALQKLLLHR